MMQKIKRPVSILLVFMMIVSLFSVVPISASAEIYTWDEHAVNLLAGDILTNEMDIYGFKEFAVTLPANCYGTEESVCDSPMELGPSVEKYFSYGVVEVNDVNYVPYYKGEKVDKWIVKAIDREAKTITLTGVRIAVDEASAQIGDVIPCSEEVSFEFNTYAVKLLGGTYVVPNEEGETQDRIYGDPSARSGAGSATFYEGWFSDDDNYYRPVDENGNNAAAWYIIDKTDNSNTALITLGGYMTAVEPEAPTEAPTYTVTWKNGDTVLETDENVVEGTMPEYNGNTPVKDEDEINTYEFAGWSPEITAVSGDVEYTATFTAIPKRTPADDVKDLINALPATVTVNDKEQIEAARNAYEALSDEEKAKIDTDTMNKLTAAETALAAAQKDADDQAAASAVTDKINALPTVITLDDKADVEAARLAYDDLSVYQTSLITSETLQKLTDAETVIANREAAKAVVDQINALPPVDEITLADKAAVEAAHEAREQLTPAQAEYLTMVAIDKLFKAEDKIRDLEAAKAVEDMINALPTVITLDDKADVEAARQAYDDLSVYQTSLITSETLRKLTDAETVIADREAAKAVMDRINALPAASEITLADKAAVEAAHEAREQLTPAQAEYLTMVAIDKLFKAEDKIRDLESAQAVTDMINALPETITADNIETVDDAYAAYQALDENQKPLVDEKDVQKLNNAVLASFVVDAISKLPENVTLDNWATVVTARGFYDGLDDAAKAFIGEDTLDKLAAAEKKIADLQAADAVIDQINALPETVTINDKEQIESARAVYDALTDDQKTLVDPDTLAKLTDAEDALNRFVLLGDVDGDGEITVIDVTLIQRFVAEMAEPTDLQIKTGDVDGDGEVTILDATIIQRYIAVLDISYPVNEYVSK